MGWFRPMLVLAAFALLGAGCASPSVPSANAPSGGLYFDAPPRWAQVGVETGTPSPLDTGTRRVVRFTGETRVRLNLLSDDFREGITEGAPEYFYFDGEPARETLRPQFSILSFEPFLNGFKIVHTSSFAREQLLVSYLLPEVGGGETSAMITALVASRDTAWTAADATAELSSASNRALIAEVESFVKTIRATR